MKNQKEQSFFSRLMKSRLMIIGEVVVLLLISFALGQEVIRKYQIEGEISDLQAQTEQLEQNNVELQSLISYFESDSYKEEQARLKLGLQRSGEKVVTVLGVETDIRAEQLQNSANDALVDARTNPIRWWDYFFNQS